MGWSCSKYFKSLRETEQTVSFTSPAPSNETLVASERPVYANEAITYQTIGDSFTSVNSGNNIYQSISSNALVAEENDSTYVNPDRINVNLSTATEGNGIDRPRASNGLNHVGNGMDSPHANNGLNHTLIDRIETIREYADIIKQTERCGQKWSKDLELVTAEDLENWKIVFQFIKTDVDDVLRDIELILSKVGPAAAGQTRQNLESGEQSVVIGDITNSIIIQDEITDSGHDQRSFIQENVTDSSQDQSSVGQHEITDIIRQTNIVVDLENFPATTGTNDEISQNSLKELFLPWRNKFRDNLRMTTVEWEFNRMSDNFLLDVYCHYEQVDQEQLKRPLRICFKGEDAFDLGALKREFFFNSFNAMISEKFKSRGIFEGEMGHLLPATDDVLLSERVFVFMGKMIAHAALNDCHGLPGLSPAIKYYLSSGIDINQVDSAQSSVSEEDVQGNNELYRILTKIDCNGRLSDEECDVIKKWKGRIGMTEELQLDNQQQRIALKKRLLIHYIFETRLRQIEDMAIGMEMLGLRTFLSRNPNRKELTDFIFPSSEKISAEMLMRCLIFDGEKDERTTGYFKQFIEELHMGKYDDLSLEDLVRFTTGSPYLSRKMTVNFHSESYPRSHSCFYNIILPTVHRCYDEFTRVMVTALQCSGFSDN